MQDSSQYTLVLVTHTIGSLGSTFVIQNVGILVFCLLWKSCPQYIGCLNYLRIHVGVGSLQCLINAQPNLCLVY